MIFILKVSQCQSNTKGTSESFAHLFDVLEISDINTQIALRDTFQASRGHEPISKAHLACEVSEIVFSTACDDSNKIPSYLDKESDPGLYPSRTKINW